MQRIHERIDDYLNFGVPNVWVIHPQSRAWTYFREGSREILDKVLRTEEPGFEIPLGEIFAAIDAKQ